MYYTVYLFTLFVCIILFTYLHCLCVLYCLLIDTVVCVHRVKELGPGGPVEGKPSEVAVPSDVPLGTMSPQNSALAMLKTSNVRLPPFPFSLVCEFSGRLEFSGMWHFLKLVVRVFLWILRFPPLVHCFCQ